jgi:hypothetical protein
MMKIKRKRTITAWSNWTSKKHKQKEHDENHKEEDHHSLEQLDYQEAQARGASWLGTTRLLTRGAKTSHTSHEQKGS